MQSAKRIEVLAYLANYGDIISKIGGISQKHGTCSF